MTRVLGVGVGFGFGIGLNYGGFQSASRFFLNLFRLFRLNPVGAIPRHVSGVDLTAPITTTIVIQILAFRVGELGKRP